MFNFLYPRSSSPDSADPVCSSSPPDDQRKKLFGTHKAKLRAEFEALGMDCRKPSGAKGSTLSLSLDKQNKTKVHGMGAGIGSDAYFECDAHLASMALLGVDFLRMAWTYFGTRRLEKHLFAVSWPKDDEGGASSLGPRKALAMRFHFAGACFTNMMKQFLGQGCWTHVLGHGFRAIMRIVDARDAVLVENYLQRRQPIPTPFSSKQERPSQRGLIRPGEAVVIKTSLNKKLMGLRGIVVRSLLALATRDRPDHHLIKTLQDLSDTFFAYVMR